MTNLHCSERDVLAMRYDRALAYLAEINIDLGNPVSRPEPDLPEEQNLKRIMREEYAKEMKARSGK